MVYSKNQLLGLLVEMLVDPVFNPLTISGNVGFELWIKHQGANIGVLVQVSVEIRNFIAQISGCWIEFLEFSFVEVQNAFQCQFSGFVVSEGP